MFDEFITPAYKKIYGYWHERGVEVVDTGAPMKMPVGPGTLGHVWNVMGEPVDGKPMPEKRSDGGKARRIRFRRDSQTCAKNGAGTDRESMNAVDRRKTSM